MGIAHGPKWGHAYGVPMRASAVAAAALILAASHTAVWVVARDTAPADPAPAADPPVVVCSRVAPGTLEGMLKVVGVADRRVRPPCLLTEVVSGQVASVFGKKDSD